MTTSSNNQTKSASNMMSTSVISLPTALLVVMTLSVASALQQNGATFSARASIPLFDAQTARPYPRTQCTGLYGSRVQSVSSSTSLSRVMRKQQPSSTLTQLQYSEDSSSDVPLEPSWWMKIFTASQSSASDSSTITQTTSSVSESEEQDSVDAYLEFLDRRYRRLHCDDKEEGTQKVKAQQDSSILKTTKPFSAMDWLMKGNGSNDSDALATTRQEQEDALYVLGVAGLASQKLLQKHHLPTSTNQQSEGASAATIDKVVELKEQIDDAIEVNEVSNETLLKTEYTLVVNNVLLPTLRVLYLVQRQKHLLYQKVNRGFRAIGTKCTNGLVGTFSQGPKSFLNTLLSIGGGKRNILRTITIGYATVLVFQPLLHAVFAEGLALEPLIQ